jgi:hypothetical protein
VAARIALALLIVGAVVALTQCKLEPDKLTGVNKAKPAQGNSGNCVSQCAHASNEAKQLENELHVQNVQACGSDEACKAAEEARHEAALAQIHDEFKRCKDGCHQQGGGNGR